MSVIWPSTQWRLVYNEGWVLAAHPRSKVEITKGELGERLCVLAFWRSGLSSSSDQSMPFSTVLLILFINLSSTVLLSISLGYHGASSSKLANRLLYRNTFMMSKDAFRSSHMESRDPRSTYASHHYLEKTSIISSANAFTTPSGPLGATCVWAVETSLDSGCVGPQVVTTFDDAKKLPPVSLGHDCIIWNNSCRGDRPSAIESFFDHTYEDLLGHSCFFAPWEERCLHLYDASELSQIHYLKDWVRTPECWSSFSEYNRTHGFSLYNGNMEHNNFCCKLCNSFSENVELFYWPDPDDDTSCLSILGNTTSAFTDGATTDGSGMTYWGCTQTPGSVLTTAIVETWGNMTLKVTIIDPWGPLQCPTEATLSRRFMVFGGTSTEDWSILTPRSVISIVSNNEIPVSTMVSDGFTL